MRGHFFENKNLKKIFFLKNIFKKKISFKKIIKKYRLFQAL